MSIELITALAAFAFVASITPGPNNLMLMASGANFGLRRTIPHMLGVGIGFVFMIVMVGIGIIGLFEAFPVSFLILKVFSVIYMLYLAWKIATAAPVNGGAMGAEGNAKPFTFLQAALFQWVNPKAWAMALTAVSVYTAPTQPFISLMIIAIVFASVNLPSISVWTLLGTQMNRFLSNRKKLQIFNWTCAALLVTSLAPIVMNAS